jgi:hypothetical protein
LGIAVDVPLIVLMFGAALGWALAGFEQERANTDPRVHADVV